jgi:TRAP-type transport system periplasmic protein
MRRLFTAGIASLALMALSDRAVAQNWHSYSYTTGALENERMEALASRISEATGGKLRIRFTRGGGMPISGNDVQQAVAEDILQMGDAGTGAVSMVPIYRLARLPGLFLSGEEFSRSMDVLRPYLEKAFTEKGVTYLCAHLYPEQSIFANRKVTSLKDIRGLGVRIGTAEQSPVVEAFGGIPVNLAPADVPPGLEKGAVSAVLTAAAGGGRIWSDLLKYNYRLPINYSSGLLIVNKARFDALDSNTQAIVRKISEEECQTITKGSLGAEDEWVKKLAEKGMVFTQPVSEDVELLRTITPKLWAEQAAQIGKDGVEALAKIRAALGR